MLIKRAQSVGMTNRDALAPPCNLRRRQKERRGLQEAINTHKNTLNRSGIRVQEDALKRSNSFMLLLSHDRQADAGGETDVHMV